MKKVIERNLPLDRKYFVLLVSRKGLEEGDGCICDNCGKLIVNTALIQSDKGERFTVGLDCVKTLTQSIANPADYQERLYSFNSDLRFMANVSKASKIEVDEHFVRIEYPGKNTTAVMVAFVSNLKKHGFQIPKNK